MVDNVLVRRDFRIKLNANDNTSLDIYFAVAEYSGNYTCEVEWSKDHPTVEQWHYLTVQVPPTVEAIIPEVEVVEGTKAVLACRAQGVPMPNIMWVSRSYIMTLV